MPFRSCYNIEILCVITKHSYGIFLIVITISITYVLWKFWKIQKKSCKKKNHRTVTINYVTPRNVKTDLLPCTLFVVPNYLLTYKIL